MSDNKERKEFCRKYRKLQYKCSLESWKLSNLKKTIDNAMESELKELKELVLNGEGHEAYLLLVDYDYLCDYNFCGIDEFDIDDIFYDEIYNECITIETLNKIEPYIIEQIRINNSKKAKCKRQYDTHYRKFKEYKAELDSMKEQLEQYRLDYLYKMLIKAVNQMNKKAKRKLLYADDLTIELDDLECGLMAKINTEEGKIVFNRTTLQSNLLDTRNYNNNKDNNTKITGILIHEICHYITRIYFINEHLMYPKQHSDNSPIFIAINYWFNKDEVNGYQSFEIFKNSKMYDEVMSKESFRELRFYLLDYSYNLKDKIDLLNSELTKEKEVICCSYCDPVNCIANYSIDKISNEYGSVYHVVMPIDIDLNTFVDDVMLIYQQEQIG